MSETPGARPSLLINCELRSDSRHKAQLIKSGDVAVCHCGRMLTVPRAPHRDDPVPAPVDRGTRSAIAAVSRIRRSVPSPR